jgi:hypothetical protein
MNEKHYTEFLDGDQEVHVHWISDGKFDVRDLKFFIMDEKPPKYVKAFGTEILKALTDIFYRDVLPPYLAERKAK